MTDLIDEITTLKNRENAVILAHYYQDSEIQGLADFTGDSLKLARAAHGDYYAAGRLPCHEPHDRAF